MKKILLFILLFSFIGCDPFDDRLSFQNNTSDTLVVRMIFDDEIKNDPHDIRRTRHRVVMPSEKLEIGLMYSWESQFHRALPDSTINVIVMKSFNFEKDSKKWDSLYKAKDYYLKRYSLKGFKKNNWIIKYPNDGFSMPAPPLPQE